MENYSPSRGGTRFLGKQSRAFMPGGKNAIARKKGFIAAILLALCLILCACASKNSAYERSPGGMDNMDFDNMSEDTQYSISGENSGKAAENAKNDLSSRKMIKDVSMRIETKDFDVFVNGTQRELASLGGFLQKSDISGNSFGSASNRYAFLTLRIPTDKLDVFRDRIPPSGNIVNESESIRDVTMEYIDIESRIKALKTEQESLYKLMEKGENLNDVLVIQRRLTEVLSDIESQESRRRAYDDLIAYSTVEMQIFEVERVTPVQSKNMWQTIGNDFSSNLYDIGRGFRALFIWLISTSPYLLLLSVCAIIAVIPLRAIAKRNKRKTAPPNETGRQDGGSKTE